MKPQLEEFMVFEDENHEMGVIIKCNPGWWKCYRKFGGHVFNELSNDKAYNSIIKLYKTKNDGYIHFGALKFMLDGDLSRYYCVYDKEKDEKEDENKVLEPVNVTINITVNNPNDIENICKQFEKDFLKLMGKIGKVQRINV